MLYASLLCLAKAYHAFCEDVNAGMWEASTGRPRTRPRATPTRDVATCWMGKGCLPLIDSMMCGRLFRSKNDSLPQPTCSDIPVEGGENKPRDERHECRSYVLQGRLLYDRL